MGQFKNEGDIALALAEECAEVIQIITKKFRFEGDWDEIPIGKDKTRWEMLKEEMDDLIFQWERLKMIKGVKVLGKINLDGEAEPDYDSLEDNSEENYTVKYYDDEQLDEWYQEDEPVDDTYLLVSTSYRAGLNETYVFPSNEKGEMTSMMEIAAMAERYGDDMYEDHNYIMKQFFGDNYELVEDITTEDSPGPRTLWKKKSS